MIVQGVCTVVQFMTVSHNYLLIYSPVVQPWIAQSHRPNNEGATMSEESVEKLRAWKA